MERNDTVAPARMTQLHLAILMHYSAINEPYAVRDPRHALSPATKEYTQQLVDRGLIYHSGEWPDPAYRLYRTTEKGQAYLDRIMSYAGDGAPQRQDKNLPLNREPRLRDTCTFLEFFGTLRLAGWQWILVGFALLWRF